jgi:diguanylate cyclase (GGDEF)-like protein/PAS domain S-box-containing protein
VTEKNNKTKSKNKSISYIQEGRYNLFQTLIDNILDYIYIKDRENRFIIVNRAMGDLFGKRPEDFIGKTDFDFAPQKIAKEAFKDDNQVIKSNKPILDKTERIISSGKESWLSSSKIPWYDNNGNVMGTMGISRDITKRTQRSDNLLSKERNIINALMNNIPDDIYFKDLNSRFVRINMACAKKHGIENPEDAIGKTDFDFFSEEHAQQAYNDEQNVIKTGKPIIDFEEKETYEDKEDRWVSTIKMPFYDKKGKIIGTFGISRDITDKKKAEEKVEYLSFHDRLTGLYNRAFFDEELKRLDTERQLPITIVMGDLNGLKVINDAYGHAKGDILLKRIADILKESFRKEDITSRWGGDEFISILPRTSSKGAKNIVKRIKELCNERRTTDIPLSISFGISTKKHKSESMDDVLKKAEDKMYKNKISDSASINESLVQSLKENLKKGDYRSETLSKKWRSMHSL